MFAQEHKPAPDTWVQAASQDSKPKVQLEHRQTYTTAQADQSTAGKHRVDEYRSTVRKAAAATQRPAPAPPHTTAMPSKETAPVSIAAPATAKVTPPGERPAVPAQKSALPRYKGAMHAQKFEIGASHKAQAAPQQPAKPAGEVRLKVEACAQAHRAPLPKPQKDMAVKAISLERGGLDVTSAGSTPRAAEGESKRPPGPEMRTLHDAGNINPQSCVNELQHKADQQPQEQTAAVQRHAGVDVKVTFCPDYHVQLKACHDEE